MDGKIGQLAMLIGWKFVKLCHSPEDIGMVWGLQFEHPKTKEKKILWILSDDEGNAPGSWDIEQN